MSNAGFESVALADNVGTLELATLGESTSARVAEVIAASRLDRIVTIANPLDVNPMLPDAAFAEVARALVYDPAVDLAVIACVPLTGALETLPKSPGHNEDIDSSDSIVSRLYDLWTTTRKSWVVVIDAGPLYDAMAESLECRGIPVFRTADRALRALSRWAAWARRFRP
jgi:acyl-CoA synthetase (NDP forming)